MPYPTHRPLPIPFWALTAYALMLGGCAARHPGEAPVAPAQPAAKFGDDVAFVRQHASAVVVLRQPGGTLGATGSNIGPAVLVSPTLQGRVLTSTPDGAAGLSYGWINRELLAADQPRQHINAYGGEDRFWLGPEGGQFGLFFAKGAPFDADHWQTPAPIDSEPWDVVSQAEDRVSLRKQMSLTNYAGTQFQIRADREVRVLGADEIWRRVGMHASPSVAAVAFESNNRLTNAGPDPWRKETGLLSIWILGMFNASPAVTVAVPLVPNYDTDAGRPYYNDDYFGKVPTGRAKVRDDVLFFKADARYRSKVGIPPDRVKPTLASYDAERRVLTVVEFTLSSGDTDYVNSVWKHQARPYAGDVANAYNDGPMKQGQPQMGNFYELESSSPAAALQPGKSIAHLQRTMHFQGPERDLNSIALGLIGVELDEIKTAFK